MSIEVSGVKKIYGKQEALKDVSFSVGPGEIVGFLGPNGAGKSTMMKIITCFIPQTSGTVKVCGKDVVDEPMEVKKRIGYLPEHNPQYLEMYVKEYLEFVGGIYQIKNKKSRVQELVNLVGLGPEQHKKIQQLSKGYRQRVGLAQALLHDPDVLILDEPTTGLDPNQIIEIRNLIKEIGKKKTVIMSTHIMQEVEAICDRVIIINKGEIVADKQTQQIQQVQENVVVIKIEFDQAIDIKQLTQIKGVKNVRQREGHVYEVEATSKHDVRPKLFQFAVETGVQVLQLQQSEQHLEDVFHKLTKSK